jgi:hypothetical protein
MTIKWAGKWQVQGTEQMGGKVARTRHRTNEQASGTYRAQNKWTGKWHVQGTEQMGGQVARTGHRTNACRVLVGQANRKIPLEDLHVEQKLILNNSYGYRFIRALNFTI